ncbi:UNVERIFIED_CONTAM: hypothetical protein GTU68_004256 [Idotea baltica]|nr:hypothetical protein [Idotea baltica]
MVAIPSSNMKKRITEILNEQGYIRQFKFEDSEGPQGTIKIALKYDKRTQQPIIRSLGRISKPGLRLGIAIISTSKGVMTDKEARSQNVGGEVVCYVY